MREILFKGKCIDETCLKGQWIEGQILHDGVTGKYYINRDNCLNESDNVGEEGLLRFVAYEVDPETVCQYTGLTDKNGRKIFEGDICKYYNPEDKNGIAIIREDHAEWRSGAIRQKEIMTPLFYLKCSSEWECIGSIFDNSEILKI